MNLLTILQELVTIGEDVGQAVEILKNDGWAAFIAYITGLLKPKPANSQALEAALHEAKK